VPPEGQGAPQGGDDADAIQTNAGLCRGRGRKLTCGVLPAQGPTQKTWVILCCVAKSRVVHFSFQVLSSYPLCSITRCGDTNLPAVSGFSGLNGTALELHIHEEYGAPDRCQYVCVRRILPSTCYSLACCQTCVRDDLVYGWSNKNCRPGVFVCVCVGV
jgi:hypothetical protein